MHCLACGVHSTITRRLLAASVLVASLALASGAHAEETGPEKPAAPEPAKQWYGWQTLTADAFALGAVGLSIAADASSSREALAWSALGIYELGGPVVHLAHDRPGTAVGSLGLRFGCPIAGGFVGALVGLAAAPTPSEDSLGLNTVAAVAIGAFIGVGAGIVTASTVDAAVLAREKVTPDAPAERAAAPPPKPFHVAPTILVARDRGGVGLGGTF